jgi:prevent-host-death family protein
MGGVEKRITVRLLNQQTSAVLNEVAKGHAVTVTSGGRPVARIVPIASGPGVLGRLVEEGIAIAPTATGPIVIPPATPHSDVDIAAAIARDRDDERW